MSGRVLSVGECMVEMAPAEDGLFRMGFAGDTFNAAWYLRRVLGPAWQVGHATAVGRDAISDAMLGFMAGEGIDTGSVRQVEGRTVGLYLIRLEGGERSFAYWRGQSAARTLADDAGWLDTALSGCRLVLFSGITLAILPAEGRERLVAALARARSAGTAIAFDTNIRPRLWESAEAMRSGLTLGAGVADVVLPSFDEEAEVFGDASPAATLARYREGGAATVAVKDGPRAVHLWSRDEGEATHTPEPVAEVVDTTAAGDSFGAAFLAARLSGAGIVEAATRASALAGRVVGQRGALARALF